MNSVFVLLCLHFNQQEMLYMIHEMIREYDPEDKQQITRKQFAAFFHELSAPENIGKELVEEFIMDLGVKKKTKGFTKLFQKENENP